MQWVMTSVARLLMIGLIAMPQSQTQSQTKIAELPSFEVASVRLTPAASLGYTSVSPYGTPRFTATNVTLDLLVEMAFEVRRDQISGIEKLGSEHYDIAAKSEGDVSLTYLQLKPRLQQLLAQRFRLAIHRETKDFDGYALVVGKGGLKLKPSTGASAQGVIFSRGLRLPNASTDALAATLASPTGRPVLNKTGIQGNFDVQLDYAPDGAADSPLPSIFTALQEQLGLKLEAQKVPVEMLVIDTWKGSQRKTSLRHLQDGSAGVDIGAITDTWPASPSAIWTQP
jgi:uncharacterized protein (TIGR03435 family)